MLTQHAPSLHISTSTNETKKKRFIDALLLLMTTFIMYSHLDDRCISLKKFWAKKNTKPQQELATPLTFMESSVVTSPDTQQFTSGLDEGNRQQHTFPSTIPGGMGDHHRSLGSGATTNGGQPFGESSLVHITFAAIRSILCSLEIAATSANTDTVGQQSLDRLMPPSSFQPPAELLPAHLTISTDIAEGGSISDGTMTNSTTGQYTAVTTSRYFSVPVLSEPSSTLGPSVAAVDDTFEVAAAVRSERQMMETFSRKGHALRSRRPESAAAASMVDDSDVQKPPASTSGAINEIVGALGDFASGEVHLLCGIVHTMCSLPSASQQAASSPHHFDSSWICQPLPTTSTAPPQHHQHQYQYTDTSGSEFGGTGDAAAAAVTASMMSQMSSNPSLHDLPHYIMIPPGHRFWFRYSDCTFSALRRPGVTLNASEVQFLFDVAFHCPVKPISRLFQLLIRSLDVKGKIPQNYHVQLIALSSNGRPSSAPGGHPHHTLDVHEHSKTGGIVMERRLVPPCSIPLTEYVQYLDMLDNGFFNPQTIPRPLCNCSRLQLAAETRNTILGDIFLEMGEVCHYYRVLSGFPTILAAHHRVMQFMMLSCEGPLPIEERFMLAVMAASRHRCEYLVRRFAAGLLAISDDVTRADDFLRKGPSAKLKKLQPLIAVFAHVPWTVSSLHIEDLVNSGEWSIPELMQAMCIVCTVLPLCGLTMGLGIPTEVSTSAVLPLDVFPQRPSATLPVSERKAGSTDDLAAVGSADEVLGCVQNAGIHYLQYCGVDKVVTIPRISRANNQQSNPSISENTFGWESGAAYYLEKYYAQFAELLSNEFTELNNVILQQPVAIDDAGAIAMNTMVRKQLPGTVVNNSNGHQHHHDAAGICCGGRDDSDFVWRALRLYILNLIGVIAEDFPYERINEVLTRGAKTFAQKSFGYPDRLCLADLTDWSRLSTSSTAGNTGGGAAATPAGGVDDYTSSSSPIPEMDGKRWFNEEVTLVLVALFTCKTRQEGLMVRFLHEFASYQRSM
jgi:hypothetical protein